jgi:hypothetical protein
MDKNFCQQIDRELLVEQYVCGRLKGDLLEKFENHLRECEVHAQAVTLEKAIKRGVSEFARGEIKTKLHDRLKKREDTRFLLLRYAAVLFVAVITPLLLYYQFNVSPTRIIETLSKTEAQKPAPSTISEEKKPTVKSQGRNATAARGKEEFPLSKQTADRHPSPEISGDKAGYGSSGGGTEDTKTQSPPEAPSPQPIQEPEMEADISDILSKETSADYSNGKKIRSVQGLSAVSSAKGLAKKKDVQPVLRLELDKKVEIEYKAIENCINTFLKENERSGYQIKLSIQILSGGEVGVVKVLDASNRSLELEQCIINLMKKWIFSPGDEDTTIEKTITYKQS